MIRNEVRHNGVLLEVVVDNEDGTGYVDTYDEGGNFTREETSTEAKPSCLGMDYFLSLPPEEQQAILLLAGGLVGRAGEIWDNTVLIPDEDPSKDTLRVVAEVALEAALPLLP